MSLLYGAARDYIFPAQVTAHGSANAGVAHVGAVETEEKTRDNDVNLRAEPALNVGPEDLSMREEDRATEVVNVSFRMLPRPLTASATFTDAIAIACSPRAPDVSTLKQDLIARCRRVCDADIRKRRSCVRRRQIQFELTQIAARQVSD